MSSWNVALPADSSKIRLSAGYIRSNWAALQTVVTAGNLNNGYPFVPTDGVTGMYFYTNTAPAGWTLINTVTDCLLAFKGGSSAYNVNGGQVVGTWLGPAYALQPSQISTSRTTASGGANNTYIVGTAQTHEHDWTTTRPTAAIGILCSKNP